MLDHQEAPLSTGRPRVLYVGNNVDRSQEQLDKLRQSSDVVEVRTPIRALVRLGHERFDGIYIDAEHLNQALNLGRLLQNEQILEGMPSGAVLLDADNTIVWANSRMKDWAGREQIAGENFYSMLGGPEILGPDFCPFHTALATGEASSSTLRTTENRYFQVHAAPVRENEDEPARRLIVTVMDVTTEMLQQQKLVAIHQAGIELSDIKPEEMLDMSVQDRVELLKANILHFTQDLLHFDVVEIRLLDPNTGQLAPLLAEGMDPEAQQRELFALPQDNGVTGFVAATGKSYLCEDTTQDPLYIQGIKGAKSSLTVPLILHDEVIGTFNVESPEPRAFGESDLQFLEIFARDLAVALNTLELLQAEMATAAAKSVEAIHKAVALPVDDILNEAVNILEDYIGHQPDVAERLRKILKNARDIKQVIFKVGQKMAPSQAMPHGMRREDRPLLRGACVLVVDEDEEVRRAAHDLLERYGCTVEAAHDGHEALSMIRAVHSSAPFYNCIIADIRLPDMNGYEFMLKLQEVLKPLPLVLMTGFGYDPGHSLVKARQAGLKAVLYKPFRLDQLLDTVESVVRG